MTRLQARLPIQPMRQPALFEDREHHPFVPVSYSGDLDTPLGCKRCGEVLWHEIHGPERALLAEVEA